MKPTSTKVTFKHGVMAKEGRQVIFTHKGDNDLQKQIDGYMAEKYGDVQFPHYQKSYSSTDITVIL